MIINHNSGKLHSTKCSNSGRSNGREVKWSVGQTVDSPSHSSNSAGALSTFQMIIQLLNKIYTSSYDLYYAAYEAYVYADNAYTDFDDITFFQSC
jgi:hypothetical protein